MANLRKLGKELLEELEKVHGKLPEIKMTSTDMDEHNKGIEHQKIKLDNHEINLILSLLRNKNNYFNIYKIVEDANLKLTQDYFGKEVEQDTISIYEDLEDKFTELYYKTPLHRKRCSDAEKDKCPECGHDLKYDDNTTWAESEGYDIAYYVNCLNYGKCNYFRSSSKPIKKLGELE